MFCSVTRTKSGVFNNASLGIEYCDKYCVKQENKPCERKTSNLSTDIVLCHQNLKENLILKLTIGICSKQLMYLVSVFCKCIHHN